MNNKKLLMQQRSFSVFEDSKIFTVVMPRGRGQNYTFAPPHPQLQ